MATTKLRAPNGANVSVDSGRVDDLLRRGFTKASDSAPAKKAAAKKSAAKKSSKS